MNKQKFYPERFFLKAFTLIELLVVIAIFGLLSSIVLIVVRDRIEQAKYARSMAYSASIKHALGDEIRGEWKFEGNCYDSSGNNNNGTVATCSAITFNSANHASSQLGSYGVFNASECDYIRCDNSSSLNIKDAITLEAWVKLNSWVGYHGGSYQLIATKGQYAYFFGIWFDNADKAHVTLLIGNAAGSAWNIIAQGETLLDIGKWHYLVGTYKNGVATLYVNAVKEKGTGMTGSNESIGNNTSWLSIGSADSYVGDAYCFDGSIDELKIYNVSLTSAQIQQHYAEGAKEHGLTLK